MHVITFTIVILSTKYINAERDPEPSLTIPDTTITSNFTYLPKWLLLEEKLKGLSAGFVRNVLPQFMEMANQRNISSQCIEQSLKVFAGIEDFKEWAIRFLDSSAKPIDGALEGTIASFGRYEECLSTIVTGVESGERIQSVFTGQYCLMVLKPHISDTKYFPLGEPIDELKSIAESDSALNTFAKYSNSFKYLMFLLGICVPSGCDRHDVNQIASYVGEQNGLIINAVSCTVKKENTYTASVVFILSCYAFIVLLVIIGTILEIYKRRRHIAFSSSATRVLLSFSLISNFKRLVTERSEENISCFDGFRVIGLFWVITAHAIVLRPPHMLHDVISLSKIPTSFVGQVILNGTLSVELFFFICGFLIGYVGKMRMEKMNLSLFPLYIFSRLRRVYPALIFALSFVILSPLLTAGPIWNFVFPVYSEACGHNWWSVLLFINNVYHRGGYCMPTFWYVACDMQLYILSFFFLMLIFKKRKLGMTSIVVAIFASMICIGIITYVRESPPTLTFATAIDIEAMTDYCATVYFTPLDHLGPHLIGLLTGVNMSANRKLKLSKSTLTLGWLLATAIAMSVLFGTLPWNQGQGESIAAEVIYASCSRVVWTMCIAWVVVCCATGHGGIINYILSWKMWIPLSRLSFTAYLIHPILQILSTGNADTVLPSNNIFLIRLIVADIAIAFVCAIPIYLMVESPFVSMVRLQVPGQKKIPKNEVVLDSQRQQNMHNGNDYDVEKQKKAKIQRRKALQ